MNLEKSPAFDEEDAVLKNFTQFVQKNLCNDARVIEVLELAPGIVSVMDTDMNINVYFQTKRWHLKFPQIWKHGLKSNFLNSHNVLGIRFGNLKTTQEGVIDFCKRTFIAQRDAPIHSRPLPFSAAAIAMGHIQQPAAFANA